MKIFNILHPLSNFVKIVNRIFHLSSAVYSACKSFRTYIYCQTDNFTCVMSCNRLNRTCLKMIDVVWTSNMKHHDLTSHVAAQTGLLSPGLDIILMEHCHHVQSNIQTHHHHLRQVFICLKSCRQKLYSVCNNMWAYLQKSSVVSQELISEPAK